MLRPSVTRRSAAILAIVALVIGLTIPSSLAAPQVTILGADSGVAIPGRYIVVLKDSGPAGMGARASGLAGKYGGKVRAVFERTLSGFAVEMSEAEALRLAADPLVAHVEQDQMLHLADTQENPPSWGLDSIDQRNLPLDDSYSYELDLAPVTAYVIDGGIRITHNEFAGRATWGWDFVDNDPVAQDCSGHGTRMAGIIGGRTFGVAKNVKLVAVRAFNCMDHATATALVEAIEWVTTNAVKPAVVNMSVSMNCALTDGTPVPCPSGTSTAVKTAMSNSISSGISYVVAAGNLNVDACGHPLSQVTGAISVGAMTKQYTKRSDSNWGSCVSLWAPGEDITSAGNQADDSVTISNRQTSTAAAHVTGAVAQMMARPGPAKTPAQLKDQLLANATSNVLTGLPGGSPNKLLYVPPPPTAGGSSVALARHQNGHLALFGVNRAGALFHRSQVQPNSGSWSAWTQSVDPNWYSVCAETDGAARLKLTGLRRDQEVWHRGQAVVNTDTWTIWQKFDGLLTSCAVASDGAKLTVFGTNAQGQGWIRSEVTPQGAYTPWTQVWQVLPGGKRLRAVAAERNRNGQVELFGVDNNGGIWHRWDLANQQLWIKLDGQLSTIALGRNKNGALNVFGVNGDGQLVQRMAAPGTNEWFDWAQMDVPPTVGTLRSLAAETNADGLITLVAVNTAGQIWQRRQTTVDTTLYGPWTQIDGLLRP